MKVLIVNGSPKGPKSNTMQMTNAVLKGLKETNPEAEIELLTVKDMDIKPCMGCMSCWGKTAGQCVINDVMQDVHVKFMNADVIIYSFPLYFFGMPGPMKTFVDRIMPLMETYKGKVRDIGDNAFHEFRYDVSGKKFYVYHHVDTEGLRRYMTHLSRNLILSMARADIRHFFVHRVKCLQFHQW